MVSIVTDTKIVIRQHGDILIEMFSLLWRENGALLILSAGVTAFAASSAPDAFERP
jgi:hypothetical protein